MEWQLTQLNFFQCFGFDNSADWKKQLSEHIDPSQLPVKYGGYQTDPDGNPDCKLKVSFILNQILLTLL